MSRRTSGIRGPSDSPARRMGGDAVSNVFFSVREAVAAFFGLQDQAPAADQYRSVHRADLGVFARLIAALNEDADSDVTGLLEGVQQYLDGLNGFISEEGEQESIRDYFKENLKQERRRRYIRVRELHGQARLQTDQAVEDSLTEYASQGYRIKSCMRGFQSVQQELAESTTHQARIKEIDRELTRIDQTPLDRLIASFNLPVFPQTPDQLHYDRTALEYQLAGQTHPYAHYGPAISLPALLLRYSGGLSRFEEEGSVHEAEDVPSVKSVLEDLIDSRIVGNKKALSLIPAVVLFPIALPAWAYLGQNPFYRLFCRKAARQEKAFKRDIERHQHELKRERQALAEALFQSAVAYLQSPERLSEQDFANAVSYVTQHGTFRAGIVKKSSLLDVIEKLLSEKREKRPSAFAITKAQRELRARRVEYRAWLNNTLLDMEAMYPGIVHLLRHHPRSLSRLLSEVGLSDVSALLAKSAADQLELVEQMLEVNGKFSAKRMFDDKGLIADCLEAYKTKLNALIAAGAGNQPVSDSDNYRLILDSRESVEFVHAFNQQHPGQQITYDRSGGFPDVDTLDVIYNSALGVDFKRHFPNILSTSVGVNSLFNLTELKDSKEDQAFLNELFEYARGRVLAPSRKLSHLLDTVRSKKGNEVSFATPGTDRERQQLVECVGDCLRDALGKFMDQVSEGADPLQIGNTERKRYLIEVLKRLRRSLSPLCELTYAERLRLRQDEIVGPFGSLTNLVIRSRPNGQHAADDFANSRVAVRQVDTILVRLKRLQADAGGEAAVDLGTHDELRKLLAHIRMKSEQEVVDDDLNEAGLTTRVIKGLENLRSMLHTGLPVEQNTGELLTSLELVIPCFRLSEFATYSNVLDYLVRVYSKYHLTELIQGRAKGSHYNQFARIARLGALHRSVASSDRSLNTLRQSAEQSDYYFFLGDGPQTARRHGLFDRRSRVGVVSADLAEGFDFSYEAIDARFRTAALKPEFVKHIQHEYLNCYLYGAFEGCLRFYLSQNLLSAEQVSDFCNEFRNGTRSLADIQNNLENVIRAKFVAEGDPIDNDTHPLIVKIRRFEQDVVQYQGGDGEPTWGRVSDGTDPEFARVVLSMADESQLKKWMELRLDHLFRHNIFDRASFQDGRHANAATGDRIPDHDDVFLTHDRVKFAPGTENEPGPFRHLNTVVRGHVTRKPWHEYNATFVESYCSADLIQDYRIQFVEEKMRQHFLRGFQPAPQFGRLPDERRHCRVENDIPGDVQFAIEQMFLVKTFGGSADQVFDVDHQRELETKFDNHLENNVRISDKWSATADYLMRRLSHDPAKVARLRLGKLYHILFVAGYSAEQKQQEVEAFLRHINAVERTIVGDEVEVAKQRYQFPSGENGGYDFKAAVEAMLDAYQAGAEAAAVKNNIFDKAVAGEPVEPVLTDSLESRDWNLPAETLMLQFAKPTTLESFYINHIVKILDNDDGKGAATGVLVDQIKRFLAAITARVSSDPVHRARFPWVHHQRADEGRTEAYQICIQPFDPSKGMDDQSPAVRHLHDCFIKHMERRSWSDSVDSLIKLVGAELTLDEYRIARVAQILKTQDLKAGEAFLNMLHKREEFQAVRLDQRNRPGLQGILRLSQHSAASLHRVLDEAMSDHQRDWNLVTDMFARHCAIDNGERLRRYTRKRAREIALRQGHHVDFMFTRVRPSGTDDEVFALCEEPIPLGVSSPSHASTLINERLARTGDSAEMQELLESFSEALTNEDGDFQAPETLDYASPYRTRHESAHVLLTSYFLAGLPRLAYGSSVSGASDSAQQLSEQRAQALQSQWQKVLSDNADRQAFNATIKAYLQAVGSGNFVLAAQTIEDIDRTVDANARVIIRSSGLLLDRQQLLRHLTVRECYPSLLVVLKSDLEGCLSKLPKGVDKTTYKDPKSNGTFNKGSDEVYLHVKQLHDELAELVTQIDLPMVASLFRLSSMLADLEHYELNLRKSTALGEKLKRDHMLALFSKYDESLPNGHEAKDSEALMRYLRDKVVIPQYNASLPTIQAYLDARGTGLQSFIRDKVIGSGADARTQYRDEMDAIDQHFDSVKEAYHRLIGALTQGAQLGLQELGLSPEALDNMKLVLTARQVGTIDNLLGMRISQAVTDGNYHLQELLVAIRQYFVVADVTAEQRRYFSRCVLVHRIVQDLRFVDDAERVAYFNHLVHLPDLEDKAAAYTNLRGSDEVMSTDDIEICKSLFYFNGKMLVPQAFYNAIETMTNAVIENHDRARERALNDAILENRDFIKAFGTGEQYIRARANYSDKGANIYQSFSPYRGPFEQLQHVPGHASAVVTVTSSPARHSGANASGLGYNYRYEFYSTCLYQLRRYNSTPAYNDTVFRPDSQGVYMNLVDTLKVLFTHDDGQVYVPREFAAELEKLMRTNSRQALENNLYLFRALSPESLPTIYFRTHCLTMQEDLASQTFHPLAEAWAQIFHEAAPGVDESIYSEELEKLQEKVGDCRRSAQVLGGLTYDQLLDQLNAGLEIDGTATEATIAQAYSHFLRDHALLKADSNDASATSDQAQQIVAAYFGLLMQGSTASAELAEINTLVAGQLNSISRRSSVARDCVLQVMERIAHPDHFKQYKICSKLFDAIADVGTTLRDARSAYQSSELGARILAHLDGLASQQLRAGFIAQLDRLVTRLTHFDALIADAPASSADLQASVGDYITQKAPLFGMSMPLNCSLGELISQVKMAAIFVKMSATTTQIALALKQRSQQRSADAPDTSDAPPAQRLSCTGISELVTVGARALGDGTANKQAFLRLCADLKAQLDAFYNEGQQGGGATPGADLQGFADTVMARVAQEFQQQLNNANVEFSFGDGRHTIRELVDDLDAAIRGVSSPGSTPRSTRVLSVASSTGIAPGVRLFADGDGSAVPQRDPDAVSVRSTAAAH